MQSVALRLIVDREIEIEHFRADEYWSVIAKLQQALQAEDTKMTREGFVHECKQRRVKLVLGPPLL